MSSRKNKELFEAICFFGKKSVVKEMRYSEFEAVLDGVVGIAELANKEVNAVYVKITSSLMIHSAVTFQIEFNSRGFADEDWNIPLRHLAENAGPGPDLGAGPIRLACRSQCSVSWYQRELWEPNQREINHFQLLQDAVARNKLGLITDDVDIPIVSAPPIVDQREEQVNVPLMSDTVEVPQWQESEAGINQDELDQKLEEQAKEFQKKVDLLIQRQKQTIHGMEEKYRGEIDQVKRAMRNEAQSVRHRAQDLEQQANQNKVLLEKLQSRNTRLERDHVQVQEQAENQTSQYDQLKDEYLELLRNQRVADDDKSKKVVELKEQLTSQTLDIDELSDEVTRLNAQNVELSGQNTELSEKVSGYQSQVSESNNSSSNQIAELSSSLERKQNEAAELKSKLVTLESDNERLSSQLTSVKSQSSASAVQAESLVSSNAEMKESLKKEQFKAQDLEKKWKKALQESEKLAQEISEAEEAAVGSTELFERMETLELVFVAYHPGAGHISLPARQLEDYLDKPLVFAAQKCSVTLEHYKSWLLHYDGSECEECGVPVKRVDAPSDYQPGINNRCSKHRLEGGNVAMFRKSS